MLSCNTGSETVGTSESDVTWLDTTGHVVGLCGGVDDLVNGLHGEVEGHELADWVKTGERSSDSQTAKAGLSDRAVDDSLVTEAVQKSFCNLVAVAVQSALALRV